MKLINPEILKSNIRAAAEYDLSADKLYGSAYIVIQKNEVVYKECFGTTSPSTTTPVSEKTIFRIASMTKPVTAVAALILSERGLISLSDPVSKYIPELSDLRITSLNDGVLTELGKAKRCPTLSEVLSHSSGIGSDLGGKMALATEYDKSTVENTVKFLAKVGLDFEPGSKAQYSSTAAFDVIACIAEKVTGVDYRTFLKREIFEPCGMSDTDFLPTDEQWGRFIAMHTRVNGKGTVRKMKDGCVFTDYPATRSVAGAGLFSTVSDYALFAKMLLNKGLAENKRIIDDKTLSLINEPRISTSDPRNYWGLAVRVVVDAGYPYLPVGSYGWSGAYGSHFWIDPENEIAAVFMKNSCFDGGASNESALNFERAVSESLE